ncbi:MAG: ATP-binding protein [Bacteroidales bacterium]|nr:ATP-binding protein [Bacteroidales bacterium]
MRNLISNAIKFTQANGQITINAFTSGNNFIFQVIDTGVGMSQKTMDKLFKIGEQFSSLGTDAESGTGLGLILCHEFIERHGGKIKVTSQLNAGSTFEFNIPIHK